MPKNKKLKKSTAADSSMAAGAIGYKKPPVEHQFRPGVSGNPNGRPKQKEHGLSQQLTKQLQKKLRIRVGETSQELSAADVIAKRVVELAAKGDVKILNLLLRLDMKQQEISREEEKRPQGGVLLVPVVDPANWEEACEKLRESYPILSTNSLEGETRVDPQVPKKRR